MAFTTEFVMGAGGAEVEEIPVSMSGFGNGTVHPLTTVDAGSGAWVWVDGEKTGAITLNVGAKGYASGSSAAALMGGGGYFTGNVACSITTNSFVTSTFTGTVYVTRV